ncbi:MAG: hypothetical protein M3Z35_09090 [Nitrospirota bacterium]|nr:hypothetical protein [Nitrospirota bacterium]
MYLAVFHLVPVDTTVISVCGVLLCSVAVPIGFLIDKARKDYIGALPKDTQGPSKPLAPIPDKAGFEARRLSRVIAPAQVVCTALIAGRFHREEMPPPASA